MQAVTQCLTPNRWWALAAAVSLGLAGSAGAQGSAWVYPGQTGRLIYVPDAEGDRIPLFSEAGYGAGKIELPDVAGRVTLGPGDGDDTARIQSAIDAVSAMPIGPDGFRGAVVLEPGDYDIAGQLRIAASGVVLRGSGRDAGGTVLHARGTSRRELIVVSGSSTRRSTGPTVAITDKTVPVGAHSFRVADPGSFAPGDAVVVHRPSTAEWIRDIGMDQIPPRPDGQPVQQWTPGSRDLRFERTVTRVEGDRVFLDAPLTNALEQRYGGGTIQRVVSERIEHVGVEHLRAESDHTSPTDEDHAWSFVLVDKAQHVFVRGTHSKFFARSAVIADRDSKYVTVTDAIHDEPRSRVTGGRRYPSTSVGSTGWSPACSRTAAGTTSSPTPAGRPAPTCSTTRSPRAP